jgi:HEAT repeat protein/small nuclear ribonucleoprotein (snRNP)-like protein
MRLKFLILLIIFSIGSIQAVKIKLHAGTIYSGTLVSANENFLYVSVNGSFIKILKSMISEIDDKPYGQVPATLNNSPQTTQTPAAVNTQEVDTSAKNTTNNVIVHLKNGNSFTGTLVSEGERIVVLNVNGSPVNIFKAIISEIENRAVVPTTNDTTSHSPEPVHNDSPQTAISSNVTKSTPVDSLVNKNNNTKGTEQGQHSADTLVKPSKLPDNKSVVVKNTSLNTPLTKKESNSVSTIANVDLNSQNSTNFHPEFKKDTTHLSDTMPKTNSGFITKADTLKVQNRTTKDSISPSASPALAQKSILLPSANNNATFAVPEKKVAKRTDGKIEIVLKNGATFIGKIISEDDRIVRFESDGVLINIIKQLISDIDGAAFNKDSNAIQKGSLITRREELSYKSTSSNAITDTLPDLQRASPTTNVPQGIKTSQLTDSLHSVSWEQRSQTTRILAATGLWGTEAIPELKKLLADTLMGSSYEPVWIDSSNVNQLLSPGDEAARALSRMGEPGFNALKTLIKDTSILVRRRAAFGLGELSTDPAWAALSEMLKDPDRGVRAVAVTGLRSTKFSDLIISMLKDEDAEVRADAAFMLGRMREHKAIRNLKTLLYDKRSFVRAQAADALCRIGGGEALQHLANASQDANLNVRENAAYALGETGDSLAVQPLISLLHDKMTSVRIAAISALGQIKDPRAIPSLYSMLKDEDPQVREAVEISLKKHTDIPTLIESLDNKKTIVKENVLYLLWLMTGQDIGMDIRLWQEWYKNSQTPLKIPIKK